MFDTTVLVGVPLFATLLHSLIGILMFLTALFLILLVLIQRGRGGGLSGAFGGAGGQSAFGTKAGDTFTRITIVAATFWILLCIAAILTLGGDQSVFAGGAGEDEDTGQVIVTESADATATDAIGPDTGGAVLGDGSAASDSAPVSPAESDVPTGSSEPSSDDSGGS